MLRKLHKSALSPGQSGRGRGTYQKVLDKRKQPIRGLWRRNGAYYARLSIEDTGGERKPRRIRLEGTTTAQAVDEMRRLQVRQKADQISFTPKIPTFRSYALGYLEYHKSLLSNQNLRNESIGGKDPHKGKRPATVAKESYQLKGWIKHLGNLRLDKIRKRHLVSYRDQRRANGLSSRTVNLDLVVFRNVLKKAMDEDLIQSLPTAGIRPLAVSTPKRRLFDAGAIDSLCEKAREVSKNGVQFADYIHLMAYGGMRMTETLRLKWADVEFENTCIWVGRDGLSKNGECRVVDFNLKLEEHLRHMYSRRAPDSVWLFPSPQRGGRDVPAKSFKESLNKAKEAANLPEFGFHDCRHFFVSMCVMSGIDFMTIAAWVGHSDGGILIGKVYGHLAAEHRKTQAQRIRFHISESC